MTGTAARHFTELVVWQRAHSFVLSAYRLSAKFPEAERFGLTSQFRRAAVSVPANIVEGFRRRSRTDKARVLNIAQASLEECRYYLLLAHDLGYGSDAALGELATEVSKLLDAYERALRR